MLLEKDVAMNFRTPRARRRAAIPTPPEMDSGRPLHANRLEISENDEAEDQTTPEVPLVTPPMPISWPRVFPGL